MDDHEPRRRFLKTMAAGYAATAFGYPANETIGIGCIGTGGRAQVLMNNLESVRGTRITAVCDVRDENLERARQIAGPAAFASRDYHALLDRKDVDVVLIGAPDHQHVPLTLAALAAGKDVYVEKPLTHDLSEGPKIVAARQRSSRIVQVGMQQRSMPHFQKGNEIVRSGQLGKIHKVHLTWNRNTARAARPSSRVDPSAVDWKAWLGAAAPNEPFDDYKLRQWRWFWSFGGGLFTDLMVHYIDVAHWFLDLDHAAESASIGDWFSAKGLWETPDTVQTLLRFPDREVQIYFEGTFSNARNGAMLEFMGSEGTLYLDRGRYEIHPERKRAAGVAPAAAPSLAYSEWVIGEGPRGADFYTQPNGELLHLANWIECVRSRKQPNAPVEAGVRAAASAHLANRALRTGQVAKWEGPAI
jgi:predicted dehydrogenase